MTFRLFSLRIVALLALLLVVVPRAAAEPIQWSYQGQITTTGPSWDQNGEPLGSHFLIGSDGGNTYYPGGRVQFADVAGSGQRR